MQILARIPERGCLLDRDYLAKILDARDTLCGYCKSGSCLMCDIHRIVEDAFDEMSEVEVEYDA